MSSVRCPTCNTEFENGEAPFQKQKVHCPKHDRVRIAGTECEFCAAEQLAAEMGADEPATVEATASGSGSVGGKKSKRSASD